MDEPVMISPFSGKQLVPGSPGYDKSRKVWKAGVDRRPAVIAQCSDSRDVVSAVRFARDRSLPVSVRGGGHSFAGHGVWDDALAIDLSLMRGIRLDGAARTVVIEPGVRWREVDRVTNAAGLAVTGADTASTGVVGMALGGGVGALHRMCGLTCDNLLAADVVTCSGEVIRASAEENADLYWGLRGGGGNLGIAISLTLRLHKVPNVMSGFFVYGSDRVGEIVAAYRELCFSAPNELHLRLTLVPALYSRSAPSDTYGRPAVMIAAVYFGPTDGADRAIRPLRQWRPIAHLFSGTSYLRLQQTPVPGIPAGYSDCFKSEVLDTVDDGLVEALVNSIVDQSALVAVGLNQFGGAIQQLGASETAFPFRSASQLLTISRIWPDDEEPSEHIKWVDELWKAASSSSAGGTYVNQLSDEGEARIRCSYGRNYERLAAVKAKYDPLNFFHINQNVKPHPRPTSPTLPDPALVQVQHLAPDGLGQARQHRDQLGLPRSAGEHAADRV